MFETKVVEKIKSNIMFQFFCFFSQTVSFMRLCGKYSIAGQAIDDHMAQALCMLDA
jgi:hypothetical protein